MSLYNLLHGMNPLSDLFLGMLNLTPGDVGRFRDCYLQKTEAGELEIHVYTRNGGGNRDHWDFSYEEETEGESCPCPGCTIEHKLPKHPHYLRDFDDDFDCTYATVVFKVPDEFKAWCSEMMATVLEQETPAEKWRDLFAKLQQGDESDPKVQRAMAVGKSIMEQIDKAPNGGVIEV